MMPTRRIAVLTTAVLSVTHRSPATTSAGPRAAAVNQRLRARTPTASVARRPTKRHAAPPTKPRAAGPPMTPPRPRRRAMPRTPPALGAHDAARHGALRLRSVRPARRRPRDPRRQGPDSPGESGVMIRVAGHTDERGSDEYNLALGQRRAAAVKAYLVQHGIAGTRDRNGQLRGGASHRAGIRRRRVRRRTAAPSSRSPRAADAAKP